MKARFGAMKSSSTSSIKLLDVDSLIERLTTNSFFLMCDLICVVLTLHVHVALRGNVEDAMIRHTKCCGEQFQVLLDYLLFGNCSFSPSVELLYEIGDEEYGAATVGVNELWFMCSSPSNNNNIVELKKKQPTFELKNKLDQREKCNWPWNLLFNYAFQNRCDCQKTKQLKHDYKVLSLDYNRLKA